MSEKRRQRRQRAQAIALAEPPPAAEPAKLAVVRPATGETGLSGTTIIHGRIHSEANSKLQWERAYGTPGSTDWGEWEKLEKLDEAVASALNLIVAPLRDAAVEVDAGEKDSDESEKIASFVRDNLKEWLEPRWPTLIEQMVKGGTGYGFSLHELVADTRPDDRVPGGLAQYLKKLAQRLPSSVKSDGWIEKDGELSAIRQAGWRDGKWKDVELPASKVMLATWNRTGNNYQGFSAFRSVWYIAQVRADLLKAIAIGSQREALGIPVATPGENSNLSKQQLDEIQRILENLVTHEHAGIVLPKGLSLEWLFSPGANKGHVIETRRALGLAILEVVQAQQMFLGTGDTGSRSVGEVHDANKNGFISGIRGWIEAVFNGVGGQPYTGVVRRIVDWNFGPQEKYPTLRLVVAKAELPVGELATAVKTLSDAGAITLTETDENHLRDKLGLKPIDPEERAKLQAEKEAARREMQAAMAGAKPSEDDDEKKGAASPPSRGAPGGTGGKFPPASSASKKLSEAPGFTSWRQLRPEEGHLALAEMAAFHTSARLEFERDVRDVLGDMVRGALPVIEEAMADGDPSELNALALPVGLLTKYVEVFVERTRAFGYRQAMLEKQRQPAGLARARAAGTSGVAPMAALTELGRGLHLADGDEPKGKLGVTVRVGKLVKAVVGMVTNRIRARVKQQIQDMAIDVARRAGAARDVVEGVLEQLETSKTLRTDAGMVVSRGFSTGREQFFEESEGVAFMQLSAILDENTCDYCESVDGMEFERGSEEHLAHLPPLAECQGGSNCRCVLIAVWEG